MAEGDQKLLTPADDGWHRLTEDPWLTEGSWWCFFVPERKLDCWLYHLSRANLGLAGGGVWVFDDTATSHLEIPYYANMNQQLLGPDDDLNHMRWTDGVTLTTLEPLTRYRMTYEDGEAISVDVTFERLTDPWVTLEGDPAKMTRWEEPCHVTGHLVLRGERIEVDSISFRDHSFTLHRPENMYGSRPMPQRTPEEWGKAPTAYVFGTASANDGFFTFARGSYLLRDGRRADVPDATQHVERDPATGAISRLVVTGTDTEGRSFEASGTPLSWVSLPLSASHAAMWVYLMSWQLDGIPMYGEIQDVWPYGAWSAFRRWQRDGA
ncbi:MAG: hypothetical protein JF603_13025 [Acidobacteria bacterium]|nr:hypothetical protein [Acidobacteriota bacterium]